MTWTFYTSKGEEKNSPNELFVGATPPLSSEQLWLDTDEAEIPRVSMVTALPSSPVDGQEVYYVTPARDTFWHLRFDSQWYSVDGRGWVFLGGAPLLAENPTDQTYALNSTTWQDAQTPGPSVTLPLAGTYDYSYACQQYSSGQTTAGALSAALGIGGSMAPAGVDITQGYTAAGIAVHNSRQARLPVQAAGTVVKMIYITATTIGGTAHARNRSLMVWPVRVT